MKKSLMLVAIISLLMACQNPQKTAKPLDILGHKNIVEKNINGKVVNDTIYHTIPDFNFTNQYGKAITPTTFNDKIYVSDFFFTSCPTICPTVKAQMHRIYQKYQDDTRLLMLSHTLDPKRDTVEKLHKYAQKLQIEGNKWHFVTGDKTELYDMAMKYFIAADEDAEAPGGITHSGKIVLIDRQKRIRSFADGTEAKQVTQLLKDIDTLLDEEF